MEKAGKLKRVPFKDRAEMEKLVAPGHGRLRQGDRRRGDLRQDRRHQVMRDAYRVVPSTLVVERRRMRRASQLGRCPSPRASPRQVADEGKPLSFWRRFTAVYAALLSWLVVLSVAILVIPVSLQIFSRYTALIPSYIWTEEMARFLFIWTIMIGAMIGVRESTHFEVDVWPQLSRRGEAVVRLAGRLGVLAAALVFVWAGIQFTQVRLEPHLRARRAAALAHPCRLAGHRRHLDRLPRRADARRSQDHSRESRMTAPCCRRGSRR